ncbi:MAG: HdeD family acid-resistance protein [Alphaproteobacteria bacterium]|nr:HdeD family acid-resistance protein [Alphaproteobacteria bacterium]
MSISLEAAAEVLREAMRETVRRHSLWYLIQGALMILAGVLALIYPIVTSVAVITLLGWLLIVSGVVQGISLIGAFNVPNFWLQLVSVALSIVVGVLFLINPEGGLATVTALLIVFFVVEGISKVIFALTIRPFPNWGWVLGSGVLGIVLAFVVFASLPNVALWLIGLLLGVQLIAEGAALGYLAWQERTALQASSPPSAPV